MVLFLSQKIGRSKDHLAISRDYIRFRQEEYLHVRNNRNLDMWTELLE